MSNQNIKIIYSLQIHIELRRRGFRPISQMPNPQNTKYTCWVYEATEDLLMAFDDILCEMRG